MKKILVVLIFIVSYAVSFSQGPPSFPNNNLNNSNGATMFGYQGGLTSNGYQLKWFHDTISANAAPYLKYTKHVEIAVGDDIYIRSDDISRWILIGGISSSSVITYHGVDSVTTSGNGNLCVWSSGIPNCFTVTTSVVPSNSVDSVVIINNQLCYFVSGTPTCYAVTNSIINNSYLTQYINNSIVNGVDSSTRLLSGNVINTGGFNFDFTPLTSKILGIVYPTSLEGHFTLDASDTLDRFDELIQDTFGNIILRKGTPSIAPEVPHQRLYENQIAIYSVPAYSTTIPNVLIDYIYAENNVPPELPSYPVSGATINADYLTLPYAGTKSLYIAPILTEGGVTFGTLGDSSLLNITAFSFKIKLLQPYFGYFYVAFGNQTNWGRYAYVHDGSWGFNGKDTTHWQTLIIPKSGFYFSAPFTEIYQYITVYFTGGMGGAQIDNFLLQQGNSSIIPSNKVVTSFNGADGVVTYNLAYDGDTTHLLEVQNGTPRTNPLKLPIHWFKEGLNVTFDNDHDTTTINATGGSGTSYWDSTGFVHKLYNLTETITGSKTFSQDIFVNGMVIGRSGGNIATNIAIGASALEPNTTGTDNIAIGAYSLVSNGSGSSNTGVGYATLYNNTYGGANMALGKYALFHNVSGSNSIGIGYAALINHAASNNNTAIGANAFASLTNGSSSMAIGANAGLYLSDNSTPLTSLYNSILIGADITAAQDGGQYKIAIGNGAIARGDFTTTIGKSNNVNTKLYGALEIDSFSHIRSVFSGDSFETPGNWLEYLQDSSTYYGKGAQISWGVGGRTTAQMLSGWATEGYTTRPTRLGDNFLMDVNCGINDIVGGALTADTVFARLSRFYGYARAVKYKVMAHTVIYSGYLAANPTQEAERVKLNDSLRAHPEIYDYMADVDKVFDRRQDSTVYIDSTHLTTAGWKIFAGVVADALNNNSFNLSSNAPISTSTLQNTYVSKGPLAPKKYTNAQMLAIRNPVTGSMVINTDSSNRIFIYTGSVWRGLSFTGDYWSTTGNTGTDTSINFIGTLDNKRLNFRVNNILSGYVDSSSRNTFLGYKAGRLTTYDNIGGVNGSLNTAFGFLSLSANTTGQSNTAMGPSALIANTTGNGNVAIGAAALQSANVDGAVAIGNGAMQLATVSGIGIGYRAMKNTTATQNIGIGYDALLTNTSGSSNVAVGYQAMTSSNSTYNTAIGFQALNAQTSGYQNTAIGSSALSLVTTGAENVAFGFDVYAPSNGDRNTLIGNRAHSNGSNNTLLGYFANGYYHGGSNSVYIGSYSGWNAPSGSDKLYISSSSDTSNSAHTHLIHGDFSTGQVQINAAATPVLNASAAFDVISTTKGVLIPRVTQAQMNAIGSPVTGLFVFNTDSVRLFSYDGVNWRGYSFNDGWLKNGNAGTVWNQNFIGTTDAQSLRFRTNNTERLRIDSLNGALYQTSGTQSINLLYSNGYAPSLGDRTIAIGGATASGVTSVAIGSAATAGANYGVSIGYSTYASSGVTIGNNSTSYGSGVSIGQFAYSDYGAAIGTSTTTSNGGLLAAGQGATASASSSFALGSGQASGNTSMAMGRGAVASHNYSIAMGFESYTTAANQFIAAGFHGDSAGSYGIKEVYFGSGPQGDLTTSTPGVDYSINGSGAYGTDRRGGTIVIAGGKGTGLAEAGDIVFQTATKGSTGTTLQSLSNRWWIKGNTGILSNTSTPDASASLDISTTTKGFLPPRMTTTQKNAISSPAEGLVVYDLTLHKLCVYTGSAWETITSL